VEISGNAFNINMDQLNNWQLYSDYTPIAFDNVFCGIGARKFYLEGYTITRISTGKSYNNTDFANNHFSMEDIEANDWIIEEKDLEII
jgi:hypothetical protein